MKIDLYEKLWMWAAVVIVAVFLTSIGLTTLGQADQPPSRVETIDPTALRTDPRFANPGVTIHDDGSATVVIVASMFAFQPGEIRVPLGRPVTFRISSPDVIHGFQIVGTNGNAMVMPGYVSQFTTEFRRAGEYLIVCNEFCGLGHHVMYATLIVDEHPGVDAAGGGAP